MSLEFTGCLWLFLRVPRPGAILISVHKLQGRLTPLSENFTEAQGVTLELESLVDPNRAKRSR